MHWILKMFGFAFGIALVQIVIIYFLNPNILGKEILSIITSIAFWVLYFKFIYTKAKKPIKKDGIK